ncbi:serine/threonine-protein kinase [Streptomyces zaomyceticus]|uniref:serine/threonine-protein kinase n=1 Tax=Streptomyces zaomyceticus TaxID=68286 RepID=UPI0033BB2930
MSLSDVRRYIGRYELAERIGKGGMGQVWAARDPELGRHVAIKLIHPRDDATRTDTEARIARFRREAQVMARLAHPGVPQIYDIVRDPVRGEDLYIVMQRLYGSTLRDICAAFAPLPISWTACLGVHLCSVLTHTGSVPLVHRDLKPANIMVTDEGLAMVLDFGIAALLDGDQSTLTPAGSTPGTPKYMSPEQIQAGEVTPRSDLYALGCVLYELLVGEPPFNQDHAHAVQFHHVYEPPVPVQARRPEVGDELNLLIHDLLAKHPEDRPASAQEVLARLARFLPRGETAAAEGWPRGLRILLHPGPAWFTTPTTTNDAPTLHQDRLQQADTLFDGGEYARAYTLYQEHLTELADRGVGESKEVLRLRGQLAYCMTKLGEVTQALETYEHVLKAAEILPPDDPFLLATRRRHGLLLHSTGRLVEAFHVLVALHRDLLQHLGTESPETARVRDALNRLRRQLRSGRQQP